MSQRVSFDPKPVAEQFDAVFDFSVDLPTGETITASTVSSLYSGSDASPTALVSGSTSTSGGQATQLIIAGVAGNVYLLVCTAVTSGGQTLVRSGYLVVIA